MEFRRDIKRLKEAYKDSKKSPFLQKHIRNLEVLKNLVFTKGILKTGTNRRRFIIAIKIKTARGIL